MDAITHARKIRAIRAAQDRHLKKAAEHLALAQAKSGELCTALCDAARSAETAALLTADESREVIAPKED